MSSYKIGPAVSGSEEMGFATALSDCLVSGVILVDFSKGLAVVTAEAESILALGLAPGLPVSLPLLPPILAEIAGEAAEAGSAVPARPADLQSPRRGAIRIRVTAVPLHGSGKLAAVALVVNDLTSVREFEAHARQVDRLVNVGTLAAGVAHEIRNALVAGRTFIDLLLERNQEAELAEVVRREMGRIDVLVSRMLKLAGTRQTVLRSVRLHEILEHALRLVQSQVESRPIELRRQFEASCDSLEADEYELEQAFVNLLLNALEAMGGGGRLTVSTRLTPAGAGGSPQLAVDIQDTGTGIAAENMRRLFEPFFTTKPSGTGLGLAVTRRIVQDHGGTIAVESQCGQGTTFQIVLPLGKTGGRTDRT
jgi:two-component system, NtrC family, nitrogen regulation sensor histidine kinase GlnL